MSPRNTLAIAARVLHQLRRDPRTLALLLVVPCVLMVILRYAFDGQPETFQRIGGPMLGLIPFITLFIVTSIAMLRERTSGTLERLMSMPVAKLDLLAGYGFAFGLVALVQTALVSVVTLGPLGLDTERAALDPRGSRAAQRPARRVPRALRERLRPERVPGGAVHAGDRAPPAAALRPVRGPRRDGRWLEAISDVLPLTYAYDALARATTPGDLGTRFVVDIGVVVGVTIAALALGAATMRRRTA